MRSSIHYTLSLALAAALFSGCSITKPETPIEVTLDSTLPTPSMNGFIADITSSAFEWKPIDDQRVNGYYVYRNTPNQEDQKLHRIATIDNRFATHYVDTNLSPATHYQYRFSSFTKTETESVGSETLVVDTLPMIAPVSYFQVVENMPRSAKLLWRPHPNLKVNGYIIERQDGDQKWSEVAKIDGRLNAEYIDKKLKDGHTYYYRVKATTFDKMVTEPSEISQVTTKLLPPDIKVTSITNNLPRMIKISWDISPVKDLGYYNVYRSKSPNGLYEYYAKLNNTTFTDEIAEDGKVYYYRVTAVDKDDLESSLNSQPLQGSTLAKPSTPSEFQAKINNKIAQLQWQNRDPRVTSYVVVKTTKTGWFSREVIEIKDIKEAYFTDANIKPNVSYVYEVSSIDSNGLRSLPTEAIDVRYEVK